MARFIYRARGAYGQVEGVQEAANASQVADILRTKDLIPVSIRPENSATAALAGNLGVNGSNVNGQMAIHTLLKAGVPILRALSGLQETTTNLAMKKVIYEIRRSLEGGVDLGASFALHPKVFDTFYVAMVRVGETSGQMDHIFMRLYKHMEFEQFMRKQVKSALRYPSFVIMAMIVAIGVINVMVIPAFETVFKSLGSELPLPTRILMATSHFTIDYGMYLAGALVVAVFIFRQWIETPLGKLAWDAWLVRMPLVGPIVTQASLSRFARAFSLSLRSGVPLEKALSSVALTADNTFLAGRIEGMRESITRGDSLTRSAVTAGVFTPMVLQMLAIGEETGTLDELLEEIGELYGNEVEYSIKTLSQQIEPILVIFLGGVVLLLALGVFLPMWDMGHAALKH
jgi:MSHA biogenesis protein MshG